MIELDGVSKAYGEKVAVDRVSLKARPGTIFGLLGPNGAGKTSTIRMILGITLPDSGSVKLFGEPFTRKHLPRVGYLPEERGLYRRMKVIDQLVFLGELHGLERTEAERRSRSWCERLEIAGSLNSTCAELSKGMQQKIQFAGTLLHNPEIVIMDEPFSGLDPVNTSLLRDILLELRQHATIILSTHQMENAERMCDEICLINSGRVALEGTITEVKSRYPSDRVLIEFDGDDSFLQSGSVVSVQRAPGRAEVRVKENHDPASLLTEAVRSARVTRFEIAQPSLEEIFVRTVR